ncbi:Oidioi.mRNA.OKI2018_I69.PAR.g12241.t1.cds [Oikopleura dioica]|uniref:Oidioi.mRNA.OKI2018_I69.PAR.g12241.t1.cds n=1 Tax=Oikopleura dioica TaxID=34765 RepID=A0ABN7RZ66_OIKDI|nr:Oidioi.mRNA.OKI2018_I69.PAR.g12241.t1.cds [Oikopleura dioica]
MVPKPASSPRPASFCYDVNKLTRDLTIDDFSDMDLSEITRDDYTSSMESLVSLRSNAVLLSPVLKVSAMPNKLLLKSASPFPTRTTDRPNNPESIILAFLKANIIVVKLLSYEVLNYKKPITKASFKELCGWGVFRPLEVDAAVLKGKVVVPTHIASFGLSAKVKGQLPVSIGEPLVIKPSENINDEWYVA